MVLLYLQFHEIIFIQIYHLFVQTKKNQTLQFNMKGGQLKKLLIVGSPRCGKTTLTQMLDNKYNCEIIRGDCLESIVHHSILEDRLYETLKTEDNIASYPVLSNEQIIKTYRRMYEQILVDLRDKEKLIILDAHTHAFDLLEKEFGEDTYIYCMAMPEISIEQFVNYLRLHDTPKDWSSKVSDTMLKKFCRAIISESKAIQEKVVNFPNVKFFDTSGNRKEKLEAIFKDIEENVIQA